MTLRALFRDAPQQLRTLWVGARFPSGGIRSPRGTITWRDTRPEEQIVCSGHSSRLWLRQATSNAPAGSRGMQKVGRHQCKRSDERDDMTTQGEESDLTARGKALTKGGHSGAVGGYLRLVFIPQQIISGIVVELAL